LVDRGRDHRAEREPAVDRSFGLTDRSQNRKCPFCIKCESRVTEQDARPYKPGHDQSKHDDKRTADNAELVFPLQKQATEKAGTSAQGNKYCRETHNEIKAQEQAIQASFHLHDTVRTLAVVALLCRTHNQERQRQHARGQE
jgi:hypothetical protein